MKKGLFCLVMSIAILGASIFPTFATNKNTPNNLHIIPTAAGDEQQRAEEWAKQVGEVGKKAWEVINEYNKKAEEISNEWHSKHELWIGILCSIMLFILWDFSIK